jgi:hypothetical protein
MTVRTPAKTVCTIKFPGHDLSVLLLIYSTVKSLPDYPVLADHLKNEPKIGCPKCVSLGVNGHYFVRFRKRSSVYNLPCAATSHSNFDIKKVKAVWLGMEESFVLMQNDRTRRWSTNLQTLYPGLHERISTSSNSKTEVRIKVSIPGLPTGRILTSISRLWL